MRDIKFEYGFKGVNGIIKKVYHLHDIPNIKDKCDVWNDLPLVYVREYTGLKDKNGIEIYESDILKFGSQMDSISEVRFLKKNASFLVKDKFGDWEWLYDVLASTNNEIIGNIYETQKLIKSK